MILSKNHEDAKYIIKLLLQFGAFISNERWVLAAKGEYWLQEGTLKKVSNEQLIKLFMKEYCKHLLNNKSNG